MDAQMKKQDSLWKILLFTSINLSLKKVLDFIH